MIAVVCSSSQHQAKLAERRLELMSVASLEVGGWDIQKVQALAENAGHGNGGPCASLTRCYST